MLNGRYGPYVTDGKRNGKIPKDRDPKSLTLEECKALLEAAPPRADRWGRKTRRRGACRRSAADCDRRAGDTEGSDAPKGKGRGETPRPRHRKRRGDRARRRKTRRAQESGTQARTRPAAARKRARAGDE